MAPRDVDSILDFLGNMRVEIAERFAVLETKHDDRKDDHDDLKARVRRLELAGVAVLVILIGKIAGVELPIH